MTGLKTGVLIALLAGLLWVAGPSHAWSIVTHDYHNGPAFNAKAAQKSLAAQRAQFKKASAPPTPAEAAAAKKQYEQTHAQMEQSLQPLMQDIKANDKLFNTSPDWPDSKSIPHTGRMLDGHGNDTGQP